jgi:hypothetical protein
MDLTPMLDDYDKKVLTCNNTRVKFSRMKTSKLASRGVEPSVKKQPVPSPKYANNNISGHFCEFVISKRAVGRP